MGYLYIDKVINNFFGDIRVINEIYLFFFQCNLDGILGLQGGGIRFFGFYFVIVGRYCIRGWVFVGFIAEQRYCVGGLVGDGFLFSKFYFKFFIKIIGELGR